MINVNKTHVEYNNNCIIKFNHVIELSDDGFVSPINTLAVSASNFNNILIKGEEPLKHSKPVSDLCKSIHNLNPNINITIETNGTIRPVGFNTLHNIIYNVRVELKNSNKKYTERINETALAWFNKAGANFIFDVLDEDDFEEINTLATALYIKPSQICISINGDYKDLFLLCFKYGFNLYFDVGGLDVENL